MYMSIYIYIDIYIYIHTYIIVCVFVCVGVCVGVCVCVCACVWELDAHAGINRGAPPPSCASGSGICIDIYTYALYETPICII